MAEIFHVQVPEWSGSALSPRAQGEALDALESGRILFFPQLPYTAERIELLRAGTRGARSKNLSFDAATGKLAPVDVAPDVASLLKSALERYCTSSRSLVETLFPRYGERLIVGRTSFRPAEIAGRRTSWRKDDTRLHVDSFPATPVEGKRILRVFSNVNPEGEPRCWRTGEPFEDVARKLVPAIRPPVKGVSVLLQHLKITKRRRTAYDHYMLKLHDLMKCDPEYLSSAPASAFDFPAGTSWMVFTDQVPHAAMRGSCAFEQTFYVPVEAMANPTASPLRILERLTGRRLAYA